MTWHIREADGSLYEIEQRPLLDDLRRVSAALVAAGEPPPLFVPSHVPRIGRGKYGGGRN